MIVGSDRLCQAVALLLPLPSEVANVNSMAAYHANKLDLDLEFSTVPAVVSVSNALPRYLRTNPLFA